MREIIVKSIPLYDGKIIILNTNNYFDPLLAMLNKAINDGFMKKDHSEIWQVANTPSQAIEMATQENVTLSLSSKY